MPWPNSQTTTTMPVGGGGNWKVKVEGGVRVTLVAGLPLTIMSEASSPVTGSLNWTWISVKLRMVKPAAGMRETIVGGTTSIRLYCQVAPAPRALNGFG